MLVVPFLLLCVTVTDGTLVSHHLPMDDPRLGGILASNAVHSRQRRTVGIVKGTLLGVKWSIDFPIRTVTTLSAAYQITHQIKLKLKSIFPDAPIKARIDEFPGDYLDPQFLSELRAMNQGGVNRMGMAYTRHPEKFSQLQHWVDHIVNSADDLPSNWTSANEISDDELIKVFKPYFNRDLSPDGELEDVLKKDRRRSREDRLVFYKDFEALLSKMGLPARPCLLRSFCEVGLHPFDDSLFGELLNILMTPSLGGQPEDTDEEKVYNDYIEAELFGRMEGSCAQRYSKCTNSVFFFLYDFLEDVIS